MVIMDRFGFKSYIREDSGMFYLTRQHPRTLYRSDIKEDYASEYYSGNLIAIEETPLGDVVTSLGLTNIQEEYEHLMAIPVSDPKFKVMLSDLNADSRSYVLEEAVLQILALEKAGLAIPEQLVQIVTHFRSNLITIAEPVAEIAEVATSMRLGKTRGASKIVIGNPTSPMPPRPETKPDTVHIHNIYIAAGGKLDYAATKKIYNTTGRLRILRETEGQWRDVNDYEAPVYRDIMSRQIASIVEEYRKGIYGTLREGEFIIYDPSRESPLAEVDDRRIRVGQNCESQTKSWILNTMYEVGVPLSEFNLSPDYMTPINDVVVGRATVQGQRSKVMETMKVEILESEMAGWSDDKIRYFYQLRTTTVTRPMLCTLLSIYMLRKNGGASIRIETGTQEDIKRIIEAKIARTMPDYVNFGKERQPVSTTVQPVQTGELVFAEPPSVVTAPQAPPLFTAPTPTALPPLFTAPTSTTLPPLFMLPVPRK
jgi:hypothetical protein